MELGLWDIPLKELHLELFHPVNQDYKDCTFLLEKSVVIASTAWIEELVDPTMTTCQFILDVGSNV